MYELSCPSCSHAVRLPFVRVGAVATCEKCSVRFQVERKHVQHRPEAIDTSAEDDPLFRSSTRGSSDPPPTHTTPHTTPGTPPTPGSPPPTADSPARPPYTTSPSPPPPTPHPGSPVPASAPGRIGSYAGGRESGTFGRAGSPVSSGRTGGVGGIRRLGWGVVSWLLTLGAMLGFVVAGLLWVAWEWEWIGDRGMVVPEQVVVSEEDLEAARIHAFGLDIVDPEIVNPTPWTTTSERYVDPDPLSSKVMVRRESIYKDHEERQVLAAIVENVGDRTISLAYLTLSLVDESPRVYARSLVPIVMLTPNIPREISVDVPDELMDRYKSIGWSVQVINELDRAVVLMGAAVSVEEIDPGPRGMVKVEVANRTGQRLKEMLFLFRATDATGRVVGSWRYRKDGQFALDQKVSFLATTPIYEEIGPLAWSLEVVGVIADRVERVENIESDQVVEPVDSTIRDGEPPPHAEPPHAEPPPRRAPHAQPLEKMVPESTDVSVPKYNP